MNSERLAQIIQKENNSRKYKSGHYVTRIKGKALSWMFRQYAKMNGSFIGSTNIGENICFPHGIAGVFISQGAKIGNDCVIFQQVTIGSNLLEDSKNFGAPEIGNNVYIGAGAKIVGGVSIGNNVRIGANAVVTVNVPDNATVVMEKPRIILHNSERKNAFRSFDKTNT